MYNAGKYVYGEILPIKYIYGTLDNDKKEKVIFKSYLQINCDLVGTLVTVTNGLRTYRGSIDSSGYCIIEIEKSGNYFIIGKYNEYESIPAKMAIVENKHLYEFDLEIELPEPEPDMDYLTFTSDSEFTLATANNAINWDGTLQYSFDKITWSVWDGTEISSSTGNVIYLRGSNNTVITGSSNDSKRWVLTGENISCSGNIETILDYKTVLNEEHPVMGSNCYNKLFKDCTALITPPELPAITLANYCYSNMFFGCTSLTSAPTLSADTLTRNCYAYMFHGCASLTEAPELPATTLADFCYNYMFYGCTSLTSAPELPATTVAARCYDSMFRNCTSLTTASELPATVLSNYCYTSMFSGCTSLTAAPELPATTLAESCYEFMFYNCTSLIEISELPATTLTNSCYRYMFNGCTSLTTLPELPATELVTNCYNFMFFGCSSIKLSSTKTLEYTIPYRIPSEGEGTTATGALSSMFGGTGGTFTGTPAINTTYYLYEPQELYLTFSSDSPFTLGIVNDGSTLHPSWNDTVEYSIDKNTWTVWDGLSDISSGIDNKIYLRGTGNTTFTVYDPYQWVITGNTNFELSGTSTVRCSGNIETLLDYNTVGLGNHPSMSLYCYYGLFKDCALLTEAPELQATVLSQICYAYMFSGCTSLSAVPELPATTLAGRCYDGMFMGCTSLTTAPIQISAPSAKTNCCREMFKNCTALVAAPELLATLAEDYCYQEMFAGCTSLITPPVLPATTVWSSAYSRMFKDCTSLSTLPELPATNLERSCYNSMFSGCTSIKISQTQTSEYTTPYRIPSEGVISPPGPSYGLDNMFLGTGGTFTGTPSINTTYYVWNPVEPNFLTFSSNGSFTLGTQNGLHNDGILEYSTNTQDWVQWDGSAVQSVDNAIYLRGKQNTKFTVSNTFTTFTLTPSNNNLIDCSGNIETLLDYEVVEQSGHPVMGDSCFYQLFKGCQYLGSTPSLPATTLARGCYTGMFANCTSLVTPPDLPATALADNCYTRIFEGCTALTEAPELAATTMANGCYLGMFQSCTSLATPPTLSATVLASGCYANMFYNCTSLTTAPELPATTLASECYSGMFSYCSSLVECPALPATTLASGCYQEMFFGNSKITTPPRLPATILADSCYKGMFGACTSLRNSPSLPATTLAISCYEDMFNGCTNIRAIPALPAQILKDACYKQMFYQCLLGAKLSETNEGIYQYPYRIPSSGTGTDANASRMYMFVRTGGTFAGEPLLDKTYYTNYPPV